VSFADIGARYGEEVDAHGIVEFVLERGENSTAHGIEYELGDRSAAKLLDEEGYLTGGLEYTAGGLVHLGPGQ